MFLTVLSLFYTSRNLYFDTDQDHLISPDQKYYQNYKAFLQEFGDWEDIFVVVKVPADQKNGAKNFTEDLVQHLKEKQEFFQEITYKLGPPFNIYLFSENEKLLFVQILPKKNYSQLEIISEPLRFLRSEIEKLKPKYPDLKIGLTGRPVLQNDEAVSTGTDSKWAGLVSFLCVGLIFLVFVKGLRVSLFGLLSLFFGISWTAGLVTLFFGNINLLTISFSVILIALGVDYGIHFFVRYFFFQRQGFTLEENLKTIAERTSPAIFLGAITSAVAFLTAVFTDFLGLQQLGIITGIGIFNCALAQLVVFPVFIKLFVKPDPKQKIRIGFVSFLENFIFAHRRLVFSIFIISFLFFAPFLFHLKMDFNLLSLQDQNQESVIFEKVIQEDGDFSTSFLAFFTKDLEKLVRWQKDLKKLPSVKKVNSILTLKEELKQKQNLAFREGHEEIFKTLSEFLAHEEALPAVFLKRLKSKKGFYSLEILPAEDVWQWSRLEKFISEVREILPEVTGAPVTTYESALRLKSGFLLVAILTLVIVAAMVWFYFKKFSDMLLALSPVFLSLCLLAGVMGFLNIPINLANFFALPILIGTGVDHAIHILHDFQKEKNLSYLKEVTIPAVVLSCLTTICGFGTLAFVRHDGLASFGLILAIGTTLILFCSVVLLPMILVKSPRS